MACDVNSPITWADVYELGKAIDKVAEDLSIPDYEKLVPDLRPFEYESVVHASFDQVFDLNPCGGTPLVTNAFINFTLTGHLKEMADEGVLAFVNAPDGCLCKTMFVVVPVAGGYSLEEFAQQGNRAVGCCQSLFVPKAGDLLDYKQHIIPAGYVATYISRFAGAPLDTAPQTLTGPACTKGGPTISYEIRAANGCYGLQQVRRPMNGFFTWPIEKRVFNEMWDRLNQIVEESCGSDGNFKKESNGSTIPRHCPVTMKDVVYTIKDDGETFDSEPGGITLNLNLPWDSPTNGGENCEDHGPKVYCVTFEHLQAIIDKIGELENWQASCPEPPFYSNWNGGPSSITATLEFTGSGFSGERCDGPPGCSCNFTLSMDGSANVSYTRMSESDPDFPFAGLSEGPPSFSLYNSGGCIVSACPSTSTRNGANYGQGTYSQTCSCEESGCVSPICSGYPINTGGGLLLIVSLQIQNSGGVCLVRFSVTGALENLVSCDPHYFQVVSASFTSAYMPMESLIGTHNITVNREIPPGSPNARNYSFNFSVTFS